MNNGPPRNVSKQKMKTKFVGLHPLKKLLNWLTLTRMNVPLELMDLNLTCSKFKSKIQTETY